MPAGGSTAGRVSTIERENYTNNAAWIDQMSVNASGQVVASGGLAATGALNATGDLVLATAPRIKTTGTVPTVGSGGAGVSVLSVIAGSTNVAGAVQATLTGIAPGVVIGVVAFAVTQASAPLFVICSLSAPTAGVAAPPVVGADTPTTGGFTIRSYGPTTVTTGTYIINYVCFF